MGIIKGHQGISQFFGATKLQSIPVADSPRYVAECAQTYQAKMCNLKVHKWSKQARQ